MIGNTVFENHDAKFATKISSIYQHISNIGKMGLTLNLDWIYFSLNRLYRIFISLSKLGISLFAVSIIIPNLFWTKFNASYKTLTTRSTFVSLYAFMKTGFWYNFTPTIKALFLFITFRFCKGISIKRFSRFHLHKCPLSHLGVMDICGGIF